MQPAPLLLEGSYFERVEIETHPDHDPDLPHTGSLRTDIDLKKLEDGEDGSFHWQVTLDVQIGAQRDGAPPPYEISLTCQGYVVIARGAIPVEEMAQSVGVTGASLLYSSAREYLLLVTGRGLWGPFQLPTVSFADFEPAVDDDLDQVQDRILEALAASPPLPVREMAEQLSISQAKVRRALQELEKSSRIIAQRKGSRRLYSPAPGASPAARAESSESDRITPPRTT